MKFSELLDEYLDLRAEGEPNSEWISIDQNYANKRAYSERLQDLRDAMDQMIGDSHE